MGSEACYLLIHRPLLSVRCAACQGPNAALRGPSRWLWGCAPRRNVTSVKRGTQFAASGVRRARGSCAATCLLCVCERVWLRDLWFFGDKTRAAYLSFSAFLCCCRRAALAPRYEFTIISFCSPIPV